MVIHFRHRSCGKICPQLLLWVASSVFFWLARHQPSRQKMTLEMSMFMFVLLSLVGEDMCLTANCQWKNKSIVSVHLQTVQKLISSFSFSFDMLWNMSLVGRFARVTNILCGWIPTSDLFFFANRLSRKSIAARGAQQEGRNPAQGSRGFGAP